MSLSALGAKVSIDDSAEALEEVAKETRAQGGEVFVKATHVRKPDMVEAWIKETVDKFGQLDGAAKPGRCYWEESWEDDDKLIRLLVMESKRVADLCEPRLRIMMMISVISLWV